MPDTPAPILTTSDYPAFASLDTHDQHAVALIEAMVRTPSVSGDESAVAAVMTHAMRELGYHDVHIDDAGNAVGSIGAPADTATTHIVMLGHMDTVPGVVPFRYENDDLMYGRGSVDAKGPLATFVIAAARAQLPAGTRITVIGAVEEEVASSKGARHVAATLPAPDACVIGEPSSHAGVTLGYKGCIRPTFSYTTPCTHAASDQPSAADRFHAFWSAVLAWAGTINPNSRKTFDRVHATIRSFNTSSDHLHETVSATLNLRLPPGIDEETVTSILNDAAPEGATLAYSGFEPAHATTRNDPVARALTLAIRDAGLTPRPKLKTGTADMNVVGPVWNCPIAAFGPGDSSLDHTPTEHLSIAEYLSAVRILTAALASLAAELSAASKHKHA